MKNLIHKIFGCWGFRYGPVVQKYTDGQWDFVWICEVCKDEEILEHD